MTTIPLDIHTHRIPLQPGTAIVNRYPDTFRAEGTGFWSVGIHPWYIPPPEEAGFPHPTLAQAKALLEAAVQLPQVLAVGEAGLDRLATAPMSLQMEIFTYEAQLAMTVNKPLVIHLVKAVEELLMLRRQLRPANPWIIHGFRGNAIQANGLIKQGLYLSFGEHYHEEALCLVPEDSLLIETDESALPVDTLYERAALIRHTPVKALRQSIEGNVRRLFFKS
ncbi:MAG: TatD family hydrolase [Prevotellaceae bacterium]|nr:TatD family hydrolase [Prevotellaceae bacterium]